MAFVFNPFTGNFDIADTVTFSPPAVDLSEYEKIADSEARDKDLQDQIDELEKNSFDDAPSDGETYGRKDAGWVTITVFVDAPTDGKQYVRKDGTWEEVTVGSGDVEEAPEDGKIYGRQDANWTEITSDGTGIPEPPDDGVLYGRQTESGTSDWVAIGSGTFVEPPADDKPYVRSNPSVPLDPTNPVGEWLLLNHTDPSKLWTRASTDPNFGPDDGVHKNDLQYVTDTDKLFIYRDIFGDGSAYYWVQCLHSTTGGGGGGIDEAPLDGEPYVRINGSWQKLSDFGSGGGGPFVDSVAVNAPLKDTGSTTSPDLGVDLNTLPPSS